MSRVSSDVEFYHNGEKITGTLFTNYDGHTEKSQTFMFMYKNTNIHISLEENQNYYNVAPLHCEIIDKLGMDTHKKYEDYLSEIHAIKREFIIVNEKVYNYYSQLVVQSPKVYSLGLRLEDGTNLDGTYSFTTIKDRENKRNLFNNLQSQAENAYKSNKIEPAQEQLNTEKTQQYQETKKLIKEIYCKL